MDIAVLGSDEFVLGFRLGGVTRIYSTKPKDYESRILELINDSSIGVLAIDSSDLELMSPNTRRKVMDSIAPVVVMVGKAESDLREKVKRAIGVDLYKTN
ncbi:MAG: V-type ATP synthase subunit F [Methanomassiliicoccales archaeon]|jgi:V/A-type H+-transporting ATPase subunit F|nr:V-type ATP synthase subunit F [Methanomassiliicoccales archaeon]